MYTHHKNVCRPQASSYIPQDYSAACAPVFRSLVSSPPSKRKLWRRALPMTHVSTYCATTGSSAVRRQSMFGSLPMYEHRSHGYIIIKDKS